MTTIAASPAAEDDGDAEPLRIVAPTGALTPAAGGGTRATGPGDAGGPVTIPSTAPAGPRGAVGTGPACGDGSGVATRSATAAPGARAGLRPALCVDP